MPPAEPRPLLEVWDPLVRAAHWLLAACMALAWLTREGWGRWHEWIGYGALGLVTFRIAWGFVGPRYARFSQFVRPPQPTLRYARQVLSGTEPRHFGHNPLGGWMIVALLVASGLAAASGWVYTTDAYWGDERVARLHEWLAVLVLVLVAIHVTGVVVASLRHRENLAGAMIHGRKRPPTGDDIV